MSFDVAFVHCSELGCTNGRVVDARHRANLECVDWVCAEHEERQ